MSCFLVRPAFRRFRKNSQNRLNFKDTVLHGWGRLILKKIEENKGSRFRPVMPNRFDVSKLIFYPIVARNKFISRVIAKWTDDFHIIMRRDLSQ